MDLSAKEMAQDMLWMEKQLNESYLSSSLKCPNQGLRETLKQYQSDVFRVYTKLFNEMEQRGWSQTATASQQAIESIIVFWEQMQERHPDLGIQK